MRIARIPHVPYLFSMKHIFRSEYSFLINTEKRKERKILNLNNHLGHTKKNLNLNNLLGHTKFNEKKGVLIDNL